MGAFKRQAVQAEEANLVPLRLKDLDRRGWPVAATCHRCGHQAHLMADFLIPRLGSELPVPEVGARLRCRCCGSKEVATFIGAAPARTLIQGEGGAAAPLPVAG